MPALGKRIPIEERFWKFVMPEPNSGCWLWTGAVHCEANPYGECKEMQNVLPGRKCEKSRKSEA